MGSWRTRSASSARTAALATLLVGPALTITALVGVAVRDHRQLSSQIRSRDAQLLTILDGLPIAVMLRAQDGSLMHLNTEGHRYLSRLGVDIAAIQDSPSSLLDHVEVIDEDGRPHQPADLPVVSAIRDAVSRDATLGYAVPEGGHIWYSVRAAPMPLADGTTGVVVTLDDVTERQEARHRVAVAERSLRSTFDNAPIGIAVMAPDGRLLQVNDALCELLGQDGDSLLAGGFQQAVHPDERGDAALQHTACLSGAQEGYRAERRYQHASGRWLHTQLSVALVRDDDGEPLHLIGQVVDITERQALEEELRAAAVEDPLTGLANRRALQEHLVAAQVRRERQGGEIGLVYIDLDGFKLVNDTHGHDVGDRVLLEVGRRLLTATRDMDTVCRMGGDEFVILCAPIDGADALADITERLTSMPAAMVQVDGVEIAIDKSIGSVLVDEEETLDDALRRADAAMYRTKREKDRTSLDGGAPGGNTAGPPVVERDPVINE